MILCKRKAFTLVELLVVVAIIGTLVGLLLPAVQSAREAARGSTCRVRLTQLAHATSLYEDSDKHLPGYVESVSSPIGSTELTWSGCLLPFLEQQALYDELVRGEGRASKSIETFLCPSNPPPTVGTPAASYLANAGWIALERVDESGDCSPVENIANGVFFDRTRGGSDIRDLDLRCRGPEYDPVLHVTLAYVQATGDGLSNTLLYAEGLNALYWGYVGAPSPNKKWDFGFCWDQPYAIQQARREGWGPRESGVGWRVVNCVTETFSAATIAAKPPNSAFPSSNHPSGVNVAFVDSRVVFVNDSVDMFVFAQLMTSNRKQSDLRDGGHTPERDAEQPGSDDF